MAIGIAVGLHVSSAETSELNWKTVQFWTYGVILKIHMIGLC